MFNERVRTKNSDESKASLALAHSADLGVKMTGHIIDRIFDKEGNLIDVIEGHNLVVNSFLNLVNCLLKGESGYAGITYWAVGSGADSWDTVTPNPTLNETTLTNEIGRVAIASDEIKFLDDSFNESLVPTHILQIKHTFGVNDCNGKWREFGIFGGDATLTADSGVIINKRHHAIITKTSEMSVERTMRFNLSLSS